MENKYKEEQPCGMLYSNGREYFLLRPSPEQQQATWESWNTFRWLATPKIELKYYDDIEHKNVTFYPHKRHIITNSFVVEFVAEMPKILVKVLDDPVLRVED